MWTAAFVLATTIYGVFGNCPKPELQKDFDLDQFAGTWYEIESSAGLSHFTKRCSLYKLEVKDKETGNGQLLHKYVSLSLLGAKEKSEYFEVTTPNKTDRAKINIKPPKGIGSRMVTLSILDTDYKTYAVAFTCTPVLFLNRQEVFIMSRTKRLDDKTKMAIYNLLDERKVSQRDLMPIDQNHEECDKMDK